MSICLPDSRGTFTPLSRGEMVSLAAMGGTIGIFRLPTDPLFYTNLTLENIVVGSRYRVTRASTGEELATGDSASTTVNLTGLPVYSNPMLVKITVRKGTTAPKYQPLDTFVNLTRETATAYIAQISDTITL